MKNALILHGIFNNHTGNWFPWLKKELEQKGYKVFVPNLITSEYPNTNKSWEAIIKKWKFDKDTIIIGHSSGAAMALGFLQKMSPATIINKAILVSCFEGDVNNEYDKDRKGLFEEPFNWNKIKNSAKEIILFHSLDDPYVSPKHAYFIQKKLGCKLIMKKHEGHFNLEKGPQYKKFPLLLKLIES